MRLRATQLSSNAHGPLRSVPALVAAMFAATTAPTFDWSASDLSTQYQDGGATGGTLPVYNVEQPVGIVLDRSKGGAPRGADLVQNGSFTSGLTGWTTPSTAPGSVAAAGGVVKLDTGATGGIARLRQAGWTTVPGAVYELIFQVSDWVGSSANNLMQMGTTAGGADLLSFSIPGNGTFRLLFRASSTASHLSFYVNNDSGTQKSYTLDNVSCKQITGTNLWSGATNVLNGWVDNGDGSYTMSGANGLMGWGSTPKLIPGRTYEVIMHVRERTAGTVAMPYDGTGSNILYKSAPDLYRRILVAPANAALYIYSNGFIGTIDTIIVVEIPGNHLIQPTSASRPTLTARTNQVLNSSFSGGGSIPTSWSATLGTTTSTVQGTVDGSAIYRQTCTVNTDRPFFSQSVALQASLTYLYTARIDNVYSGAPTISNTIGVVNLPTGASASYRLNGSPVASNTPISSGDLVGLVIGVSTTAGTAILRLGIGTTSGTLADIAFSRPSLEFGDTPSRFQRNTSATDYDTVGFAKGWRFDGVDDGMYSPANLDLTSTNKLSITMAVLATNLSGTQILMETGASYGVGTGRFEVSLNEVFAGAYTFARRAPTPNNTYQTELAAASMPRRGIYSALSNGDSTIGISTRVDGMPSTRGISNPDTTPAHSSDVIYFGRRNNASNPFQGVIYSARVIGRRVSPDELGWLEALGKLDLNNNL